MLSIQQNGFEVMIHQIASPSKNGKIINVNASDLKAKKCNSMVVEL